MKGILIPSKYCFCKVCCLIILVSDGKYEFKSDVIHLQVGLGTQKGTCCLLNIADSIGKMQSIRDIMFSSGLMVDL